MNRVALSPVPSEEAIASILGSLTLREREALALWTFDGLGVRRIGKRIGISRRAVQKRIIAAKRKLKAAGVACVCRATQQRAIEFSYLDGPDSYANHKRAEREAR